MKFTNKNVIKVGWLVEIIFLDAGSQCIFFRTCKLTHVRNAVVFLKHQGNTAISMNKIVFKMMYIKSKLS